MFAHEVAKAAIGKVQKNYILLFHSQNSKRLTRFPFSQLSIVAIVPRGGARNTILCFHPFRETVTAGHKHDLDRSTNGEHSLDKTSGSQSLIVWMRGKYYEPGVFGEEWVKRLRGACPVCVGSDYYRTHKKA